MTRYETEAGSRCDIVVPVHNYPRQARACIESISGTNQPPASRLIVVNDQSDEYTTAYLKSLDGIELIENRSQIGFLQSANKGLFYSDSDYVCLVNSHTVMADSGWLTKLIGYADSNPDIGLVCPVSNQTDPLSLTLHPGADIHLMAGLIDTCGVKSYLDAAAISASCLLIRRRVIETIGGFDEALGNGQYGESDYHFRARKAGFNCKTAGNIFYFSDGKASRSDETASDVSKYRALYEKRWATRHPADIQNFDTENESCEPDNQPVLNQTGLHGEYDILFILPPLEDSGSAFWVAALVNEFVRKKIKANIVCLDKASPDLGFEKYFEPLHIPEAEIKHEIPRSKLYAATHSGTVWSAYTAAKRHRAKAFYLIQEDERLLENRDRDLTEATYSLIPNHVYVSNRLADDIGKYAGFIKTIGRGIHRDLFYPGTAVNSDEVSGHSPVVIAMATGNGPQSGIHEGITAINRLLAHSRSPEKLFFRFFGHRQIQTHEINTENFICHGRVDQAIAAEILSDSAIFIDSSRGRGLPLYTIEAMSSGCACIIPENGGDGLIKHMENALVFTGGDIDHLFQMLQMLLDCPFLREKLQKSSAASLVGERCIYNSAEQFEGLLADVAHFADLPDSESVPHLKYRLILAEKEKYISVRKDVQISHLKNELTIVRQKLYHYIHLYKKHASGSEND